MSDRLSVAGTLPEVREGTGSCHNTFNPSHDDAHIAMRNALQTAMAGLTPA